MKRDPSGQPESQPERPEISRRDFMAGGTTAMAAVAVGLVGASPAFIESMLRKNFREMSPAEVDRILAEMQRDYTERLGKQVSLTATPAQPGTLFGYALDLSRCVGCRRCVYACVDENNQSRDPQIHWIRVLKMDKKKGVHLAESDPYYDPDEVPEEDAFYMPVACQQCSDPPCVKVCPVEATWQEPDGIVVIDYDWCLGCRCCMAACPYGARHFNWVSRTFRKMRSTPTCTFSVIDPVPRESSRSAPSASTAFARDATRPVWRSVRSGRASSATCWTRRAKSEC